MTQEGLRDDAGVSATVDPAREPEAKEYPLWPLLTLFVFSGFAALVYQVMWMRSFGLVFGSTTRAAAIVLAAFFFGMALGNWLGGRLALNSRIVARHKPQPLFAAEVSLGGLNRHRPRELYLV